MVVFVEPSDEFPPVGSDSDCTFGAVEVGFESKDQEESNGVGFEG